MRKNVWVVCAALGGMAAMGTGVAEEIVELDLDGVLGNGPDTLSVAVGDSVPVDVWFDGEGLLQAILVYLCNPDGGLEFLGLKFHHPPAGGCWSGVGPQEFPGGCVRFEAQDLCWVGAAQPWRVATMTYGAAADDAIAELAVGSGTAFVAELPGGTWVTAAIDGSVGAIVRIGDPGSPTGTRGATWSSVKGLFR